MCSWEYRTAADVIAVRENTLVTWLATQYPQSLDGVLGGRMPGAPTNQTVLLVQPAKKTTDEALQLLWEMDQVPNNSPNMTSEETRAVEHFHDTHQRTADGRFIVKLPRKEPPPPLGQSKSTAIRRFLRNEKSLRAKGQLEQFQTMMNEYFYAEVVPDNQLNKPECETYYFPIHGVVKEASMTMKLRAVFDASCKTSSGYALNDQLIPGPNLYPLLTTVLNRFRMFQVSLTADISKMFREILLHTSERDFHRFIHRQESGQLVSARMKRLTFGVTTSPFLATQTLHKLADLCEGKHPRVSQLIKSSFYVDDCLAGAAHRGRSQGTGKTTSTGLQEYWHARAFQL